MRVLLDTNIVIHRENKRVTNYSIGHLFRWLDRLKHDKILHPLTVTEIQKYRDPETQDVIAVKLESYELLKTILEPSEEFLRLVAEPERTPNDRIDNCLLYEVYLGRVDMLITEDRKLRNKAIRIGLHDKVFSIDAFISKATGENPSLIEYKALSVEKVFFGSVDHRDSFFDSFRVAYNGFDNWFLRKCDEEAYICRSNTGKILGFLYLKTEDTDENYADIEPAFAPKRRLKVGTFKVESTGFRLGERFIKIIFDNAIQRNVDEIYVTLFTDREELAALNNLLERWGFIHHGVKHQVNGDEKVLVKKLNTLTSDFSPKKNFPNISYQCNKFIMPIYPQYHTSLLPDSKLANENIVDFLGYEPHRYALQKVYVSWASTNGAKPGDLILFYRMGEPYESKKYKSVITTVAMVDEIIENIRTEDEFLSLCQNRSVFSVEELKSFWQKRHYSIKVLKFVFVKSLSRRITLGELWDLGIVQAPNGPRSFSKITDDQFDTLLKVSGTQVNFIK